MSIINQTYTEQLGLDDGVSVELTLTQPGVLVFVAQSIVVADPVTLGKPSKNKFPRGGS